MIRLSVFLAVILFGCTSGTNTSSPDVFDRGTTDASELFFKNVRQSYYNVRELADAGMNVFDIKSADENSLLRISLIHHWRTDEASVLLEFRDLATPLALTIETDSLESPVIFDGQNVQDHIELALRLFKAIQNKEEVRIGEFEDALVFANRKQREAFRITMIDFLTLTENRNYIPVAE